MLKKSGLYIYAAAAAILLVSVLASTNVKACEDIPQSLLALYMNSDVVVLANYDSDVSMIKTNEDEYGYSLEIERNLSVVRVFKGNEDLKTLNLANFEYRSNPNQPQFDEGEYYHFDENYFDISKIRIGSQYLFFLKKNQETGKYGITDYGSAVKETAANFGVYEKFLVELKSIAETKENRLARLTEWIVKTIEEPVTRQDGINDLAESFYSMDYQDESIVKTGTEPFLTYEDYNVYTAGIAKNLTESQKARVSAALYPTLQDSWFAAEPVYVDYQISTVLGRINKSRLAVYTFNMLQSVDKRDSQRKQIIMEFLTSTISDSNLSEIYYEYVELDGKITDASKATTPESKVVVKTLTEKRNNLLKDFEKRFRFMFQRNFAPVDNMEA